MTELLSGWIRALAGSAVFCAAALALCPKGKARGVLAFACGCLMLTALVSPLREPDVTGIAEAAALYRAEAARVVGSAQESARAMERSVIEEGCEAYVASRADALGLAVTAEVGARWSEAGCFYPWECSFDIPYDAVLASAVEAGLGIPPERMSWEAQE